MAGKSKLNPRLVAEIFEKENANVIIYDHFAPNLDQAPVTKKFYSVHEAVDLSKADLDIVKKIEFKRVLHPRLKYPRPVCESHRYGWFSKRLIEFDREDRRLHHPLLLNEYTEQELRIKQDKSLRDMKK